MYLSESDKRFIDRQAEHEAKRRKALDKAGNRGRVSEEWHNAGNKLTAATMAEFKALMKKADADWEKAQKQAKNISSNPVLCEEDFYCGNFEVDGGFRCDKQCQSCADMV